MNMPLMMIKVSETIASPTNPKGREKDIAELVASIKEQGILQPVLARPIKNVNMGKWMVIAGNRRLAAAKVLSLKEIPADVREMTDDEARQAQIVENLQRKDIHPLDEAAALISLVREVKDIAAVAAKVGKSRDYVLNRIRLNNLDEELKKAYRAGEFGDGHAAEIATLSPGGDQQKAATHIKDETRYGSTYTVAELKQWIEKTMFDPLAFQPWLKNPEAAKAVGECNECPKETNTLFGEIKEGACTTTRCCARKMAKYIKWAKEQTPGLFLVTTDYRNKAGVLGEYDYERAAKDTKGAKPALIVDGKGRGRMIHIKIKKAPSYMLTPEQKEAQEKAEEKERADRNKKAAAELVKRNKAIGDMLGAVTVPIKINAIDALFEIAMGMDNIDLDETFSRYGKAEELKRDDYGNADSDEVEKAVRELYASCNPQGKLQLVFDIAYRSFWDETQKKIKKALEK